MGYQTDDNDVTFSKHTDSLTHRRIKMLYRCTKLRGKYCLHKKAGTAYYITCEKERELTSWPEAAQFNTDMMVLC